MEHTVQLNWTKAMSVGNGQLDFQHQVLMALTNELNTERAQADPEEFARMLSELSNYMMLHFDTETAYMKKHGYPYIEKHKAEHRLFIFSISRFNLDFEHNVPTKAAEVHRFVTNWLADHELRADMGYKDFINKKKENG